MTRTQPIELQESSDMHVPQPPSAEQYMASPSYREKVPIVIDNGECAFQPWTKLHCHETMTHLL